MTPKQKQRIIKRRQRATGQVFYTYEEPEGYNAYKEVSVALAVALLLMSAIAALVV